MTGQGWLVAVLLVVAATAVAWPVRAGRARRRAVLERGHPCGASPSPRAPGVRRRSTGGPLRAGRGSRAGVPVRPLPTRPPGRRDPAHPLLAEVAPGAAPARLLAAAVRRAARVRSGTGQLQLLAVVLGGGAGAGLGGPVAAVVLAAYATLAARALRRRHVRQLADRVHRDDLDQLCALAADLRAGLPVGATLDDGVGSAAGPPGSPGSPGPPGSPGAAGSPRRIARMARAAVRLADRTGAPLAELLERVEAGARAADRGLAAAAAQAAGARATAWLLAALPLGGIALGYAIGVDPVAVLLHTTVGGGSALAAVALQIGGLLWAERLGTVPGRAG